MTTAGVEVAPPIPAAAVVTCFLQGRMGRIRTCHERLYKDAEQITLQFLFVESRNVVVVHVPAPEDTLYSGIIFKCV